MISQPHTNTAQQFAGGMAGGLLSGFVFVFMSNPAWTEPDQVSADRLVGFGTEQR